jgi:hypothetical protein
VASPNDYAIFETHYPWGYTVVKDAVSAARHTYASGTSYPKTARSIRSSGRCLLTLCSASGIGTAALTPSTSTGRTLISPIATATSFKRFSIGVATANSG